MGCVCKTCGVVCCEPSVCVCTRVLCHVMSCVMSCLVCCVVVVLCGVWCVGVLFLSFSLSQFFSSSFSSLFSSRHQTLLNFEAFACDLAHGRCTAVGYLLSSSPLPPPFPSPSNAQKKNERGNFLLQEYFRRGIYFLLQFFKFQKLGEITVITVLY